MLIFLSWRVGIPSYLGPLIAVGKTGIAASAPLPTPKTPEELQWHEP